MHVISSSGFGLCINMWGCLNLKIDFVRELCLLYIIEDQDGMGEIYMNGFGK